jgi:hypothetical protein
MGNGCLAYQRHTLLSKVSAGLGKYHRTRRISVDSPSRHSPIRAWLSAAGQHAVGISPNDLAAPKGNAVVGPAHVVAQASQAVEQVLGCGAFEKPCSRRVGQERWLDRSLHLCSVVEASIGHACCPKPLIKTQAQPLHTR